MAEKSLLLFICPCIPFILFLALIAILYIANGYYADDKIREVNKVSNQLKELRSEYISTKISFPANFFNRLYESSEFVIYSAIPLMC